MMVIIGSMVMDDSCDDDYDEEEEEKDEDKSIGSHDNKFLNWMSESGGELASSS